MEHDYKSRCKVATRKVFPITIDTVSEKASLACRFSVCGTLHKSGCIMRREHADEELIKS